MLAILLLPAAELLSFLLVAWWIGFFAALGLMVLTSLAGGLVLRYAGRGRVAQIRVALRPGGANARTAPGREIILAIAGILLLLPGFITDLIGAGLLIGPLRRWLGATIGRAIWSERRTGPGAVVDLEPDEWRSVPDDKLPRPDTKPR